MGSDVNIKDMGGRTPLFVAAKFNHEETVKLLLSLKANASSRNYHKQRPYDVTTDDHIKHILAKAQAFMVTTAFGKKQKRLGKFEREGLNFFKGDDELGIQHQGTKSSCLLLPL